MLFSSVAFIVLSLSGAATAQAPNWGQCGGQGFTGPTVCNPGWNCIRLNTFFSQCLEEPKTSVTCENRVDWAQGYGALASGGGLGTGITVTSCAAFRAAAKEGGVIRVSGILRKCGIIDLQHHTTILGNSSNSGFVEGGLRIKDASDVVIRNLKFNGPPKGHASILLENSGLVWIDHNEFRTDGAPVKDPNSSQIDITHGSFGTTISWNKFQSHGKGSLVGYKGVTFDHQSQYLSITYHHNLWASINADVPSFRVGTAHIYSSCFENIATSGLNIGEGARALIENNHFINVSRAITTNTDANNGFVTERNNLFDNSPVNITHIGHEIPTYSYSLDASNCVCERVYSQAGVGIVSV